MLCWFQHESMLCGGRRAQPVHVACVLSADASGCHGCRPSWMHVLLVASVDFYMRQMNTLASGLSNTSFSISCAIDSGWRRFQSVPVYALEDANGRQRMLKYTPEHMHCLAVIWGKLAPPNTGFLAIQKLAGNQAGWRISATGVRMPPLYPTPPAAQCRLYIARATLRRGDTMLGHDLFAMTCAMTCSSGHDTFCLSLPALCAVAPCAITSACCTAIRDTPQQAI